MWLIIRTSLLFLLFAFAVATPDDGHSPAMDFSEALVLSIIIFILGLIWVPVVCAMDRLINRFAGRDVMWHLPSLSISPFTRYKPTQFWYYCSLLALVFGLGLFTRWVLIERCSAWHIVVFFAAGIGLYSGVRLTRGIFNQKFMVSDNNVAEQVEASDRSPLS